MKMVINILEGNNGNGNLASPFPNIGVIIRLLENMIVSASAPSVYGYAIRKWAPLALVQE